MRKILPVINDPPLKSHQYIFLPLCAFLAETCEGNWNWFYNEFTQIFAFDLNKSEIGIKPYQGMVTPFGDVKIIQSCLEIGDDITDFFKILINNDYYIVENCDDFYIKELQLKYHRQHDFLIYGYDNETRCFMVKAQHKSKLCDFEVPYSQIIEAHNSKHLINPVYNIFLYKYKESNEQINIEKLKWHLLDYIEGTDTLAREAPTSQRDVNMVWGIKVFDRIKKAYQSGMICGTNNIYCWYEHRQNLLNKFIHFDKYTDLVYNEQIKEEMENICKKSENIFKLCMKVNIKIKNKFSADDDIKLLCKSLDELKPLELNILNRFYKDNKVVFEGI